MSRITSTILVFMILANGSITVMEGSGLTEDIGVTLAPGVDQAMDDVISDAKEGFSPAGGVGSTLFSLFSAAMGTFQLLIQGIFSLPGMFLNLGFPSWFVLPLFAPMYVVATLEFIYMASGRNPI